MRDKFIIAIMLIILFSLLAHIGLEQEKRKKTIKASDVGYNTMEELAEFITLENEIAENKLGTYHEKLPVEDIFASITVFEEKDPTDTDINRKPEYVSLYPNLYTTPFKVEKSTKSNEKIAYLTFDDGPSENTWKVLDILDQYKIKATFFVIGKEINIAGEDTLLEIVDRGHLLGLHTYNHKYKEMFQSVDAFLEDYDKLYTQVYDITGIKPNIYRFPGGSYNGYMKNNRKEIIAEMERRGFTYIDWNVSGEDTLGSPTIASIKKNILKHLDRYTDPVLLLHDGQINSISVKALPDIIEMLIEKGYSFDTLDHREPYQFNWKK